MSSRSELRAERREQRKELHGIAFEHNIGNAEPLLFRLVYMATHGKRRLRTTVYYRSQVELQERLARIPEGDVLLVRMYRLANE